MLVLPQAQATEIRQKQHEELATLIARNPAATKLLKLPVNEFHAPKLHKAAPKAELGADDRVYFGMGGDHHRANRWRGWHEIRAAAVVAGRSTD